MRALVITPEIRASIEEKIQYAQEHCIVQDMLVEMGAGSRFPIGDDLNFVQNIPYGVRVVFSIEQHPMGWSRHISISVDAKGQYPSIELVQQIMQEYGFIHNVGDCTVWLEKDVEAVNVIEHYDDQEIGSKKSRKNE